MFSSKLRASIFGALITVAVAQQIPGVDFTKPGPMASPAPSPATSLPSQKPSRRRSRSDTSSDTAPNVGIGASGNNQGYSAGEGKFKLGF